MRSIVLSAFTFLFLASLVKGQVYQRKYDVPVTSGVSELSNAWAGGLNSCQVSTFDANLDGLQDLFIFDRIGSRINVYINESGVSGEIKYRYTQEYNAAFPQGLNNWVLLRDMNCDGKKDICTNTGSGFRIFWNTSVDYLSFNPTSSGTILALYDFGGGSSFNAGVYCIAPDIPAFDDYDGDGDIDIWSWNDNSTGMYIYINRAVENGNCAVPDFVCKGRCYGAFGESPESFQIFTGEDFTCDFNFVDPRESGERMHTGGTILTIDLDSNGMKDLIIGDVTESNLVALLVDDNPSSVDSVTVVQYDFPAQFGASSPVNINQFPAGYYEDVNNDGVRDLLISTNDFTGAEDRKSLWLYLNTGTNNNPVFELITQEFLQSEMIDLGTNAYPTLHDLDGDGLQDLFVSNRLTYSTTTSFTSKIAYYKNVGTTQQPQFQLMDDNWLDIPSLQLRAVYLSFGDLDGDGDSDIILGEQEGRFYKIMNDAVPDGPANFTLPGAFVLDNQNSIIDVGQLSTPQLIDLDQDGLIDLVSGEMNGNVNYYRNSGTLSQYVFVLVEDTIGDVVATSILGIQGRSVPHFFVNQEGLFELILGTETGFLNHYRDIETNILGTFELVTTAFHNIFEGQRSAPAMADLNGDQLPELIVGNVAGGLGYYVALPSSIVEQPMIQQALNIFPNPADGYTILEVPFGIRNNTVLQLYDLGGRLVYSESVRENRIQLNTSVLETGLYQAVVTNNHTAATGRLLVFR